MNFRGEIEQTRASCGENDATDLEFTRRTRSAKLDNDCGGGLARESASAAHDNGPSFSEYLSPLGDFESFGNDIGSSIEVNDLASRVLKSKNKKFSA